MPARLMDEEEPGFPDITQCSFKRIKKFHDAIWLTTDNQRKQNMEELKKHS
jgi:hypothetical protein